eukprot:454950_1
MVKLEIVPLTEAEVELVQNTIELLGEAENRRFVLENIIAECPDLAEAFSMVVGVDRQSAFLMNMMKRGFNYVCYQSFDAIYDIFVRHPKYNITLSQLSVGYKFVVECIGSKTSDDGATVAAWTKLCDILEYIADVAYNRPDDKKLDKMKKRVMRSMSAEDIATVQESWLTVLENEIGVAEILAHLLNAEKKIIAKFHEHSIDVFKQSVIILRMIGKTLKQLDDIEMLIPYLKKLGGRHVEMTVGPRLLAMMKPIMVATLRKALGFSFTDAMEASWNKVLSFIIGIMVEVARNNGNETTKSGVSEGDCDGALLTDEVVQITQATWREVMTVIDAAVGSFYRDLLKSKPEIRNLFSRSNMQSQANKLLRAIGSTIALLDNQETLVPILEELGRRHVYYNVRPKYFKHLKKAWFNMLKQALALKWTAETERSWNIAWKFITSIMISSLEDALLLYIPADPEKVKLKVLINHIDRVQVQNLSFYGDVWFAAYTGDNPSQSAAFQLNNENATEKAELDAFYDLNNKPKEYAPFGNIRILNSMDVAEMYRHKKERYLRKYAHDETWFMRGNLRGTFAQMYDLRAFPFDQHELELTIALEVDDTIAILDEESLFVRLMPFKRESMAGADWDVYSPSIFIKDQSAVEGGSSSGKKYTHAQVTIPIARKWHHHIYETILPLLLIEIVAYGVYFAEEFPMVERLTVVVTLLLTLFAFKWTVAKSMPPTPYLTLMDYFFNTAYMMLFLHIAALCLLSFWEFADEDTIHQTNWLFCAANLAVFVVIHGYLFYKARYYYSLYPKQMEYDALGAVANALTSPNKKKSSSSDDISRDDEEDEPSKKNKKKKSGSSKYKVQPVTHEA